MYERWAGITWAQTAAPSCTAGSGAAGVVAAVVADLVDLVGSYGRKNCPTNLGEENISVPNKTNPTTLFFK